MTTTKTATLLSGVPAINKAVFHAIRFDAHDPASIIVTPDGKRTLILRDVELMRAKKQARADEVFCYEDFEPADGGFPKRMPLPTILLGRLAVDLRYRGHGLGSWLLIEAIRLAVRTTETIGLAVIEVDARDADARSFYDHFGFASLSDDSLHMYLPMKTAESVLSGSE